MWKEVSEKTEVRVNTQHDANMTS